MSWQESLETVIARTNHQVLRGQCADANPNSEQRTECRKLVMQMARYLTYPSLAQQAVSAVGAVGRAVGAIVTGEPVLVSAEVLTERQAICGACEQYDAAQKRCKVCGCGQFKPHLATERCPLGKWDKS